MDEQASPSSGVCLPVTLLSSGPGGPCVHWGLCLLTPFGVSCKNPLGGGGGNEGRGAGMLPGSGLAGGLLPLQPCCSLPTQAFVAILQSFWAPGAPCSPPNLVNPPSLILPKLLCWGPWLLLGLMETPHLCPNSLQACPRRSWRVMPRLCFCRGLAVCGEVSIQCHRWVHS